MTPSHRYIDTFLKTALVLLALYLGWVAFHLKIDYFDSFENYLNSWAWISRQGEFYSPKRPFIFSAVQSAFFLIEDRLQAPYLGMTLSHSAAVFFLGLTWFSLYRLFRLHLSSAWALTGVFLFALNPLLIHMAPFSKEDIPGILMTVLTFYFYLRGNQSRHPWDYVKAGLCLALAMDLRRNLIPQLPLVFLLFELATRRLRLSFSKTGPPAVQGEFLGVKLCALFVLPVLLFLMIPSVFYPVIGRAPFWKAPFVFIGELQEMFRSHQGYGIVAYSQHPAEIIIFLMKSVTWPLLVCFLAGLVNFFRERNESDWFYLLWFFVFFSFAALVIYHKEARYLFPFFPPVYFLAVRGWQGLYSFLGRFFRTAGSIRWGAAVLAAVLLAYPLGLGFRECVRFRDPVYRTDIHRRVSEKAVELAGPNSICWYGQLYAIYPQDFIFDSKDEYTYFYHFFQNAVQFYTRRKILELITKIDPPQFMIESRHSLLGPRLGHYVQDGDVLIVNLDPHYYFAGFLPMQKFPLIVARVRKVWFDAVQRISPVASSFRSSRFNRSLAVFLKKRSGSYAVRGYRVPSNLYGVYAQAEAGQEPVFLGVGRDQNGYFEFESDFLSTRPAAVKKIFFLYFDAFNTFWPVPEWEKKSSL